MAKKLNFNPRQERIYTTAPSEEEILKKLNDLYSGLGDYSEHYAYPKADFFLSLRRLLIRGDAWIEGELTDRSVLVERFKKFYRENRHSTSAMQELTYEVITSFHFEDFLMYFQEYGHTGEFAMEINKDFLSFKKYIKKYLETYEDEAKYLQDFIINSFYDSELEFSVSNKGKKIKVTWHIDQKFLGSDSRADAVWALFNRGCLIEYLGEFSSKTAPKVIKKCLFDRHPHLYSYQDILVDKSKDFWEVFFWPIRSKSWNKICNAWESGELGRILIIVGEKAISLDWDYPESFRPFEVSDIRSNVEFIFKDVALHMYPELDKEISLMIDNCQGLK